MMRFQRVRLKDARLLAKRLSKRLKGGEILGLVGPLGSGKTVFAKALAKGLKVRQKVASPTFTLMHPFPARLANKKPITLYHLDLYRTKTFREVKALGITEAWGKKNTVTLIEWADKIRKYLPKKTFYIQFRH